mmetsp:Transcript_16188/g.50744  ORF Transcript_16188/g.50744 Transcript_16188/m.50744 type:complete len:258 (-) Transcript_16188:301-1074(-)
MWAVIAPFAGKPQKMHMVSMKFLKNGSVTSSSTVLWSESKVSGRSRKTSGCVVTNGREPAVVARKPASCRRFRRETAVVEPPRVFSRRQSAFHSRMASSPSSACSRSDSKNPPGASGSPSWNRQYRVGPVASWFEVGIQYPSPSYVSTSSVSSRASIRMRSGFSDGLSRPSKIDGPTSNEYFPPSATRENVCAEPPILMCDSSTIVFDPYLALSEPHASPPIPDPITTTSYSPLSPDIPSPVPLYTGFSYTRSRSVS